MSIEVNEIDIDIDKMMLDIFKKNAEKWKMEVSRRTPKGHSKRPLKNSIEYEINEEECKLTIWAGKKYYIAHFVEFGTVKQRPQPFFRPAFDTIVKDLENEISRADISKYIK